MKSTLKSDISKLISIGDLAQLLMVKYHALTVNFQELRTVFLFFLTISVTSASVERSFSRLKMIKDYIRCIMTQDCLSDLTLLSNERGTDREVKFEDLIDKFAEVKAN